MREYDYEGNHKTGQSNILELASGLKGKNNRDIYDGDIVRFKKLVSHVFYSEGCFWILHKGERHSLNGWNELVRVVGNVHDNIDLIT